MAFMGRGGASFGGAGGGINTTSNVGGRPTRAYRRGSFIRLYYFIPLDNTYVIFQMLATFLILIVGLVTILATYKSPVIDPISSFKKSVLYSYIAINIILISFIFLANYNSKDKVSLIRKLVAILFISLLTFVAFLCVKLNANSIYNKSKFEQIYMEQNDEDTTDSKTKFALSLEGMKMETKKEYFVDECLKAYKVFSIRMLTIFGVNLLIVVLLIYQIIKVIQIQEKREQLDKNDAILFDEEQNCRY